MLKVHADVIVAGGGRYKGAVAICLQLREGTEDLRGSGVGVDAGKGEGGDRCGEWIVLSDVLLEEFMRVSFWQRNVGRYLGRSVGTGYPNTRTPEKKAKGKTKEHTLVPSRKCSDA